MTPNDFDRIFPIIYNINNSDFLLPPSANKLLVAEQRALEYVLNSVDPEFRDVFREYIQANKDKKSKKPKKSKTKADTPRSPPSVEIKELPSLPIESVKLSPITARGDMLSTSQIKPERPTREQLKDAFTGLQIHISRQIQTLPETDDKIQIVLKNSVDTILEGISDISIRNIFIDYFIENLKPEDSKFLRSIFPAQKQSDILVSDPIQYSSGSVSEIITQTTDSTDKKSSAQEIVSKITISDASESSLETALLDFQSKKQEYLKSLTSLSHENIKLIADSGIHAFLPPKQFQILDNYFRKNYKDYSKIEREISFKHEFFLKYTDESYEQIYFISKICSTETNTYNFSLDDLKLMMSIFSIDSDVKNEREEGLRDF